MTRRQRDPAATRQSLLDATFSCLYEEGYHRTSTANICKRAAVARGTMLHHFPTREALVLAAIEEALDRRLAEFEAEISSGGQQSLEELGGRLWRALKGPAFAVWLELAVASRT